MPKKFDVSWTAPADDGGSPVTGYDVSYTPDGGSETVVDTGSSATSYEILNLTDGVEYSVKVRAKNAIGAGAYSETVTQVAEVVTPAPAATGLLLNFENNLTDSGPSSYTFSDGGSGYSSSTVKFGSFSRSYVPYSPDTSTNTLASDHMTGDFTIEMFVNIASGVMGNYYGIGLLEMLDDTFTYGDMIALWIDAFGNNGAYTLRAYLGLDSTSSPVYLETPQPFPDDGAWHHVAFVREGTTLSLYLDGTLQDSNTSAGNLGAWGQASYISMVSGGYSFGYDGLDGYMDDFRVSGAALYTGATYTVPDSQLT